MSSLRSDQRRVEESKAALEQQQVVERAMGVLMERHGLTTDTAAERIRQLAAGEGIAVGEVAARLVGRPPSGRRRRSGR